ncbi:MAG: hypothetical protein KJO34_01680 [Deltaproteobacteria bacterium]|nr:hypothetical protein [Deltaproteobacteria bacterium]
MRDPKRLKVLFIGNSHTYFNFMPQMLVLMVKAAKHGFSLEVEQCTGKGVSLEWHWNNPTTRKTIATKNWDYIVLQERSAGPLEESASFDYHAQLLDGEIKNQGAQTILYMTWANRSRFETQSIIAGAYEQVARKIGAILAPVGSAWKRVFQLQPKTRLHHDDDRHANPVGSYLAACVFYVIMCGHSPVSLPEKLLIADKVTVDLDEAFALFLHKIAFEIVSHPT